MQKKNGYKLTIAALMHSVFTFNLFEGIEQLMKLLLDCKKTRKELNLDKLYASDLGDTSIPKLKKESFIDTFSPRLAPSICATNIFHQV